MDLIDTVPEWSGLWLETDEVGYLEISDSDDRLHRPPPGWTLIDIDECPEHSSQIFRYVRTEVSSRTLFIVRSAALAAATMAGVAVGARPLIRAILATKGLAA